MSATCIDSLLYSLFHYVHKIHYHFEQNLRQPLTSNDDLAVSKCSLLSAAQCASQSGFAWEPRSSLTAAPSHPAGGQQNADLQLRACPPAQGAGHPQWPSFVTAS